MNSAFRKLLIQHVLCQRRSNQLEVTIMRDLAMKVQEEAVEWKMDIFQADIGHDWAELTVRGLSSEQKKAILAHLQMNITALRQLQKSAASH